MPTRSRPAVRLGEQAPRVRHAPRVRANDWEDVSDLAKAYGLVLDEWQENVLEAALGVRSDGRWAATTVGVNVARQNGKGALIEARELAGLLLFGEKVIIHSAHEQKTARQGFQRTLAYFENFDDLRKKVRSVMAAVNREHIKLKNGAELHFPARSKGAIRGFTIDCLILDEAQILGDAAWEAIKPTISARPNAQTWLLGTTPTPLDDSAVFSRTRQRGVEGRAQRLAWCEWSAPLGSELDDRDVWALANPALGTRISEESIESELHELSPEGFARERLSMWPDDLRPLVMPNWPNCSSDETPGRVSRLGIAVDLDRVWISVGAVSAGTVPHLAPVGVETDAGPVVLRRRLDQDRAFVIEHVKRIQDETGCSVVFDRKGAADSLEDDLRDAGVNATPLGLDDFVTACADVFDAVAAKGVSHGDYPELNEAVRNAGWRKVGPERRVWAPVGGDVSMLKAVTLAFGGPAAPDQPWGAWM